MSDMKLKDVRMSFPTLGVPEFYQGKKQRDNDERRWSVVLLVPVTVIDPKTKKEAPNPQFAAINAAIEEIAKAKWEKKWKQVLDANEGVSNKTCWLDGKKKAYEGYQGHWALTCIRKESAGRPGVFDTDKTPIYQPNGTLYEGKGFRVYAGSYVNAHVNFWAQDNSNGQAIRCELIALQRNRDGDAFSGGMAVDADQFDEITEGADAEDDLT
jgi:hypothetical protein